MRRATLSTYPKTGSVLSRKGPADRNGGYCEIGAGGKLAESGATTLGGSIPVNTSGGLESKGHPMGATGLAQIYELVGQLRGENGARQVPGARIALAENGGGGRALHR
jgi:acetyl-CoA acyltransferase